jgi:hypothetical protein
MDARFRGEDVKAAEEEEALPLIFLSVHRCILECFLPKWGTALMGGHLVMTRKTIRITDMAIALFNLCFLH